MLCSAFVAVGVKMWISSFSPWRETSKPQRMKPKHLSALLWMQSWMPTVFIPASGDNIHPVAQWAHLQSSANCSLSGTTLIKVHRLVKMLSFKIRPMFLCYESSELGCSFLIKVTCLWWHVSLHLVAPHKHPQRFLSVCLCHMTVLHMTQLPGY